MRYTNATFVTVLAAACAVAVAGIGVGIAAGNHQIIEADKTFSSKSLEISVGDTVTFVNEDKVKHNITVRKLNYNSGLQSPGENIDVTFDKAGKFKVRCGIHPKMKLSVVVN